MSGSQADQGLAPEMQKLLDTISGRKKTYVRNCRLCRLAFATEIKEQEFHTVNCRVKYSTLLKELGEEELTDRLNYLEDRGELPPVTNETTWKLTLNRSLSKIKDTVR